MTLQILKEVGFVFITIFALLVGIVLLILAFRNDSYFYLFVLVLVVGAYIKALLWLTKI